MQKRGQVAVFVIIGIIILIAFAILVLVQQKTIDLGKTQVNNEDYLNSELKTIQKQVLDKCAEKYTKEAAKKYLENGGGFTEPSNYIKDNGRKYRILCQKIPSSENCLMQPLLTSVFSEKLNEYLNINLNKCINLGEYKNRGYTIEKPTTAQVNNTITNDVITIIVDYPFSIEREGIKLTSKGTEFRLALPIGELFKEVNYILKEESVNGIVDPISYQVVTLNKYKLIVKKPYPDRVHTMYLTDYPEHIIYFAIEKEGRYPRYEGRRA